jgi:hypothetical protein
MPNRIIRAELLESEAWLSLKDNADRTAWLAAALTVDNFGDMPAGAQRLCRLWRVYGIDTQQKAAQTLSNLADVDLVRGYRLIDRPYLHIPRFRQKMRWVGHAWPLSPWATNEEKQLFTKKYHADHRETQAEVEVEVEVDNFVTPGTPLPPPTAPAVKINGHQAKTLKATRLAGDWVLPEALKSWAVEAHHLDPQRIVRISLAFRDYWISKPGKDGTKLDWAATWRNWVRKEVGDA